jgi:hypothetical protein
MPNEDNTALCAFNRSLTSEAPTVPIEGVIEIPARTVTFLNVRERDVVPPWAANRVLAPRPGVGRAVFRLDLVAISVRPLSFRRPDKAI